MEVQEKIEQLRFTIERFDHYYDSVNNKGAFYIGLNTFIFGGICVGYLSLYDKLATSVLLWIFLIGLLICNILSTYFTIAALMPFLKNSQKDNELPSLLYFGGISAHKLSHFQEEFVKIEKEKLLEDFVQQTYCLAGGLNRKYKKLKAAGHCIIAQFITMLPFLLLIVKNLK